MEKKRLTSQFERKRIKTPTKQKLSISGKGKKVRQKKTWRRIVSLSPNAKCIIAEGVYIHNIYHHHHHHHHQ